MDPAPPSGSSQLVKDIEDLKAFSDFFRLYRNQWRKLLNNFLVLVPVVFVGCWIFSLKGGVAEWPWYNFPIVVALSVLGFIFGRNFLICTFDVIRFLPVVFNALRAKQVIYAGIRARSNARVQAQADKIMAEATAKMAKENPEAYKSLRDQGFI
jgi:hypothetical protein